MSSTAATASQPSITSQFRSEPLRVSEQRIVPEQPGLLD